MTHQPEDSRTTHAADEIQFSVVNTALGTILVAGSAKGICAILPGDDGDALLADLKRRFPGVTMKGGDALFEALAARVAAFVESPERAPHLPLDLRGTAFQRQVWQALRDLPAGTTTTYGEIARRIGKPKAARAVAQACGANPLAILVPCHRVLGSDGSLAGYRWGVERKRWLLKREQVTR